MGEFLSLKTFVDPELLLSPLWYGEETPIPPPPPGTPAVPTTGIHNTGQIAEGTPILDLDLGAFENILSFL
jgi:hypothetical protein